MSIHPTALQILEIVEKGGYTTAGGKWVDIRALQSAADRQTEVVRPAELEAMFQNDASPRRTAPLPTRIEVIDATTQEAAQDLSRPPLGDAVPTLRKPGGVVLLNFASAKNPGGGFLGGAKAQEEDICRCSGLFPLLAKRTEYYEINRAFRSALYTDHSIYSRDVPFFRAAASAPLLDEPFVASVITAPAPNAGALMQNEPAKMAEIRETFDRRWRNVLALAEAKGHETLLLGAWGCGAFHNDPEIVASTVARWLRESPRFAGRFARVVFAIPSFGRSLPNLTVFRRCLG